MHVVIEPFGWVDQVGAQWTKEDTDDGGGNCIGCSISQAASNCIGARLTYIQILFDIVRDQSRQY